MTITRNYYPFFEVPIVKTIKGNNLNVELTIYSTRYNGESTALNTPKKYQLKKLNTVGIEDRTAYGTTLTQQDFPDAGIYYGFITAQDRLTNDIIDLDDSEVVIILSEPDLNVLTNVSILGERLTYGQALEYVLSKNFNVPFPLARYENGKQVFELYSGYSIPFVAVDDKNGGALPLGSYIEVYDKITNRQVPVSGKMRLQLFQSNEDGTPKGFADAEPIYTGLCSYTYISDLPLGDYYAKVYSGLDNREIKTVPFKFNNPKNC